MKKLNLCTSIVTASAIFVFMVFPSAAHATPRDEDAMETVATQLMGLWTFVDESTQLPDEQFYPEFSQRAAKAHTRISHAYDELNETTEVGAPKSSIQDIQHEITTILKQLDTWQAASKASDAAAFQAASDELSSTATSYNEAVASYTSVTYGDKATMQILLHVSILLASFACCMLLFARAFYQNTKTQDAAGEILRRLRWHEAFASVLIAIGSLVPFYIFFFTDATPLWWTWILFATGIILVGLGFARASKAKRLDKKHA